MTEDELRETAATVEDSLAQLAGQAQQLEVKAVQLAAELKRPISEKARRNLRAWYGLDLPANANYATALQIKLPWLEISLD